MVHGDIPERPTRAQFEACLEGAFTLNVENGPGLCLELVEVTSLGVRQLRNDGGEEIESFTLLFRGPLEPVLPQAIYPLENARLGHLDVFVVPVGRDEGGVSYEAVFN